MTTSIKHTLLLIDDEPDILEVLSLMIESFGFNVLTANSVTSAIKSINDTPDIAMCLTDMSLPDGEGTEIIQHIAHYKPNIPVAVFTAHGNIELAVKSLQLGAFDFISKPVKSNDLKHLLEQGVKNQDSANPKTKESQKSTNSNTTGSNSKSKLNTVTMDGTSEAIESVRKQVTKIAKSQAAVHISGPSGSGKELAAKMIHQHSRRFNDPFIAVNCGAIPSELVESELFGHKKGSFSGATTDTTGLFRAANGGTLFLDEIADLPLTMQVKLLRAIQEKKVRPVGSTTEYDVDIRLISATHKNLKKLVSDEQFREDLYFRINVLPLRIPSLSERKQDIEAICCSILSKINNSTEQSMTLSSNALLCLKQHSYNGNVRELENILERACAMSEHNIIHSEELLLDHDQPEQNTHSIDNNNDFILGIDKITDYLDKTEQQAIRSALEQTNGNKTKAAELLGISFRTLKLNS